MPSDAVRVWVPPVWAGTVYAQELKLPVASAVQAWPLLPSTARVIVLFSAKPRPLTTTR
jgi:hypothetical protein